MSLKRVVVKPYDRYKFEVWEDFNYQIELKENEFISGVVPKGYTTDGASIPRIFWSLYPPYKSEYFSACVLHDYLCSRAMHETSIKEAYKRADLAFYKHLRLLNVNFATCFIFYHWVDKFHKLKCYFKGYK
ncbi:DUF1353 domain-containing protein [Campylobacter upsaliensis]|nr:DUF1353 domain-containing protein [Campylobacter upsaliensis]EAL8123723.1 DUF1353 domain-containing protein [Campylobacter upsaliensis]EGK8074165.1 DUF1353 domain-containing protein [Campylobacter upsaliensis]EIL6895180.1 DUF1353 domain-containing protein [Campylobacter upsaliensis]HEF3562029.1 DUF1353 domain-containing protein [Campylobacter upsaliensis]